MAIIDFYDDPKGSLLRTKIPYNKLPPVIKKGHVLTHREKTALPNHLYALIISDGTRTLRKFACPDAANTALSTFYFLENWKELPEEAVKTAAANLITASSWYSLPAPKYLHKLALSPMSTGVNMWFGKGIWDAGRKKSRKQLTQLGINPYGRGIAGEPYGPKQASAELIPFVDVTNAVPVKEKLAKFRRPRKSLTGRTPQEIKQAVALYTEKRGTASPQSKVEFSRTLIKQAKALGMYTELPQEIRVYGGTKVASPQFLEAGLLTRQEVLDPSEFSIYIQEVGKLRGNDPNILAEKIAEIEQIFQLNDYWGDQLPDPWYITRGMEKTGEYRFSENGKEITGKELSQLTTKKEKLKAHFGANFANEFAKDPITIFKSMPLPHKKILMTLAKE